MTIIETYASILMSLETLSHTKVRAGQTRWVARTELEEARPTISSYGISNALDFGIRKHYVYADTHYTKFKVSKQGIDFLINNGYYD